MKNPLGRNIPIKNEYDPGLLYMIPREKNRKLSGIGHVSFEGYDIWNLYELSWLDSGGKPEARTARIIYPADSEFMIESKSLKLYLTGLSMMKFKDENEAADTIKNDISKKMRTDKIDVILRPWGRDQGVFAIPEDKLLDKMNVVIDKYTPDKGILLINKEIMTVMPVERYSHLLRTNCPITGQPDWGSVHIKYSSRYMIDDASLLKYIVSYRLQSDFHETACERIFSDIRALVKPELLVVKCFYTRRGGIDINPVRYTGTAEDPLLDAKMWRQ